MKKVYVAISADIIHHGHIDIFSKASEYGEVIVGLYSDSLIASHWRAPFLSYDERKKIVENIKGVVQVIPQEEFNQLPNLLRIKPDYVIYSDDWKDGSQKNMRESIIKALSQWQGELIEIETTDENSVSKLEDALNAIGTTPQMRMKRFRRLIEAKPIVRILEAHNGLTGLIAEKTKVEQDGQIKEFDGIWISSLCDSTAKGKPDIELVDLTSRLNTIHDILEVTTKPIILDGDTGGQIEHFVFTVKTLERLGVSAIIIEDKIGLKKNSLFGTEVEQTQDTIEHFCEKISAGSRVRVTKDFMIIARIESLILNAGLESALLRAKAYIKAGANGIMIHSQKKTAEDIISFCKKYNEFENKVPLVVVPTSYSHMTEAELSEMGANIVIYANHLIRSAYPAMVNTAKSILLHERAMEADNNCMSISEIINLI